MNYNFPKRDLRSRTGVQVISFDPKLSSIKPGSIADPGAKNNDVFADSKNEIIWFVSSVNNPFCSATKNKQ